MIKKLLLTIGIALSLLPNLAYGQVTAPAGGTGLSTYTAGDMIYANTNNPIRFTKLPIGNNGFCLTSNGSAPVWGSCGGGGGSSGGTWSTTTSQVSGQLINYPNNTTDIPCIGGTATSTCKFWFNPNTQQSLISYASSTYITAVMASTSQAIFNGGPWVDARTCGAKGDGSTDDSSAINTCINNLNSAGGGKLYISAAPNRTVTTKYKVCAGPITMKSYVDVEVQRGVEIQVCNGYASSTVQFISGANGTYFSHWKGGTFSEAGTGQKLWTAFNVESQNINGGVFWNTISDVIINLPSICIRSSIIGTGSGWLNSNTYRDIVCNDPTNAFTFNDDRTGSFVIDETLFDNVQIQANSSTETCFGDLKAWNTQLINNFCYDMNATSTSLSINQASLSTLIEGGYMTAYNFVDNGQRTTMVGDRLWPLYATSTNGSFYQYANGAVLIGTTTTNATTEALNIIDSKINLGIGTSKFNSKILFYRAGAGEWQQDYMGAATTSAGNPNSGDIGISARQGIAFDIDSDNTVTDSASTVVFQVRNNRSDIGNTTTNLLFKVDEQARITSTYASTTAALSAATICLTGDTCRTTWPTGGGSGNVSTSSAETANQIPYWTSTSGTPAALSGGSASLTFDGTKFTTTYASTTELSVARNAYLGTSAVAGTNYNLYVGTTTPMLQTNTGPGSNVGNLLAYQKTNSASPGFVTIATAAMNSNSASVIPVGSGVCYSTYEGSNGSGRTMWADCSTYYNTLSFIGAARVNFIANSSGVLSPWQYVTQVGNVTMGATTTDLSASLARLNVLNIQSSTQDIFHADQGTGIATTTVFAIKSTGFTGIATSSPHQALTVNGNAYIAGWIVSTSTSANVLPYASSTAASASTYCLDTCITAWPSAGGGAFPFTATTNFNQTANSTTTQVWFKGSPISLTASSTSVFDYASTTGLTTFGDTYLGMNGRPVMINTTSSNGDQFRVSGSASITSSLTLGGSLIASEVDGGINSGNNLTLKPSQNSPGNNFVLIAPTGGYVGIGTSSPYATLSVVGSTGIVAGSIFATSTTATSTFAGGVDLSTANVKQHLYPTFTYATSTAWTGTTTIPLGPAFRSENWNGVMCFTDTGTLNVSINDGTNRMNLFNASTTVGTVGLTTNNSFTVAEKRYVDIGTPASSPTKISCTIDKTINP